MSSAYFAQLVLKPAIITRPGRYRTRDGEIVEIATTSGRHDFGCRGRYASGVPDSWHRSGRLYATSECLNDLVEAVECAA